MIFKDYKDCLGKARRDYSRLDRSNHLHDCIDCISTLNAFPEWMLKSDDISNEIRQLVVEKISIMKGENDFRLNEDLLGREIDHQLRYIRLFSNEYKHASDKSLPEYIEESGATLPATLPSEFCVILKLGKHKYNAKHILHNVICFWGDLLGS